MIYHKECFLLYEYWLISHKPDQYNPHRNKHQFKNCVSKGLVQ